MTLHATLDATSFRDAAAKAALAIGLRHSIPILDDILLTAADGTLSLYATDMEIAITSTIPADIREPGRISMSAKALIGWLKSTSKGALVEIEGETLRAGMASATIRGNDPDDMPIMTLVDPVVELVHPDMAGEFAKVSHAISTEQSRYYLTGVYFCKYGQSLRMVATDGHRMAITDTDAPHAPDMPGIIIAHPTVTALSKLLKCKTPIPVEYAVDKRGRLRFRFGNIEIVAKAIDGTFPDYERCIPRQNQQHATFTRADLADAANAFAKLTRGKGTNAMRLDLDGNGSAELTITDPETGKSQRTLIAHGDAIEIGFQPRYLAQTLGAMTGDDVELWFDDATGPALIRDPHSPSTTHVLMPCRV